MKPTRTSPIWPYLGILACLFVLALTAPRSWQRTVRPGGEQLARTPLSPAPVEKRAADLARAEPISVDPPAPVSDIGPRYTPDVAETSEPESSHPDFRHVYADAAIDDADSSERDVETSPLVAVDVEDPFLAASDRPAAAQRAETPIPAAPELSPRLIAPQQSPGVRVSSPDDRLALLPSRPAATPDLKKPDAEIAPSVVVDDSATGKIIAPEALLEELDGLAEFEPTANWARFVKDVVTRLTADKTPDAAETAAMFKGLEDALADAPAIARRIKQPTLRTQLLRTDYAIKRRRSLWKHVLTHESASAGVAAQPISRSVTKAVRQPLAEIAALTDDTPRGRAWREYLMIDALQQAAVAEQSNRDQQRQLAEQVVKRLDSVELSPSQRQFIDSSNVNELRTALSRWTLDPADPVQLLADLETYEQSHRLSDARQVANGIRSLAWSSDEDHRQLGEQLQRHYRNANLRIAVKDELLNRWLPKQRPISSEVCDHIAGADVQGCSRTTTHLAVRLVPDPHKVRIGLEAFGVVQSDTEAASGPARLYSEGQTTYRAAKLILLDQQGLRVAPAAARADTNNELVDVETDYDNVPFLRSWVHKMVRTQHREKEYQARSEVEQKVIDTVCERMDQRSDPQLAEAEKWFRAQILSPIENLSLRPTPIDMHTTNDRMVMRVRLADNDQLGAHTPRPQAPSDSLISLQVHETVLNNAAGQLKLDGRTFTLPELFDSISERIGQDLTLPDDISETATITFAERDAIRMNCSDGKIEIMLSIAELAKGSSRFRNFQVRAFYKVGSAGLVTQMHRDGSVQLIGRRLGARGQIVLRGVFSKLFSQNRPIPLIDADHAADPRLKGLAVSRISVEDGWLGLAIAPERRLALRTKRTR